jgi:hypothetical protein
LAEKITPTPEGWDWFAQNERQVAKAREEARVAADEIKLMYESAFGTDAGRAVLEDLKRWILAAEGFAPELGFWNGAAQGFYREGQRRMVGYILKQAEKRNA